MDTTLLRTLRDGIREEIAHYEQLLDLTTREQEILAEETYSSELANVAAEKLKVMREINDLTMRIGPLKVRWKLEESRVTGGDGTEISPLLEELGSILERILDVDEQNQQILARLVSAAGVSEANAGLNAASAERAYNQSTPRE
jgi:flagellar biosynthesis/type III secretory pathway chaperone